MENPLRVEFALVPGFSLLTFVMEALGGETASFVAETTYTTGFAKQRRSSM